jgi:hypothetical protein
MTVTVSDAIPVVETVVVAPESPVAAAERTGAHARMRARDYRSPAVVGKVKALAAVVVVDLRSAWWTPASLPTVQRAWAQRVPDRERVPGNNPLLYGGWVTYNHTVGLLLPAVAMAAVGLLTLLVWVSQHPARLALAAAVAAPIVFPMIS